MRNLYILGTPISGLFRQGKFHYYLLFTAIIEFERTYLISNLVHQHKMKKRVADELKLDKKLADIQLSALTEQQLNKLRVKTRKSVKCLIEAADPQKMTLKNTLIFLGSTIVSFFIHPWLYSFPYNGYLALLQLDAIHTVYYIVVGGSSIKAPKAKQVGDIMLYVMGITVSLLLIRKCFRHLPSPPIPKKSAIVPVPPEK